MGDRTGHDVTCPCGAVFYAAAWQLRKNQRYCSLECAYRYRPRWTGRRTYTVHRENPSWIKPGQRLNPDTEFKPGELPHNYKGDQVGYDALHDWVRRYRGEPQQCEHCGHDGSERRLYWANKSHEYRRDLEDWLSLCSKCHAAYDREHRGAMRRRFPEKAESVRLRAARYRAEKKA